MHPQQHAAEMVICLVVFGPLLVVTYRRMVQQMRALRIRYQPSRAQQLWAYLLLLTLVLQSPLKLDVQKVPNNNTKAGPRACLGVSLAPATSIHTNFTPA